MTISERIEQVREDAKDLGLAYKARGVAVGYSKDHPDGELTKYHVAIGYWEVEPTESTGGMMRIFAEIFNLAVAEAIIAFLKTELETKAVEMI